MAKETTETAAPIAPLFQLTRTFMDEMERQSDKWAEYAFGQGQEGAQMVKALRSQVLGAQRTALQTFEQLATSAWTTAQSYAKPFGKGAA